MTEQKRSVERTPQELQRDVLYALTESAALWTTDELARELEEPFIRDQVQELQRAGLIHQTSDDYVFASRSAARQVQIFGRVL